MGRFVSILALAFLTACNLGPLMQVAPGQTVSAVAVFDGAVTVAGPPSYCVDPQASRPSGGFILLAACGAVGGDDYPRDSALLSAQVGAAGSAAVSGSEPVLANLLATSDGAASMGLSGTALSNVRAGNNEVVVMITRRAGDVPDGVGTTEWRVFTDVGDRLVTLTVRSIANEPLSNADGRRLLLRFLEAVRQASPAT
jgi:hypothetical protein